MNRFAGSNIHIFLRKIIKVWYPTKPVFQVLLQLILMVWIKLYAANPRPVRQDVNIFHRTNRNEAASQISTKKAQLQNNIIPWDKLAVAVLFLRQFVILSKEEYPARMLVTGFFQSIKCTLSCNKARIILPKCHDSTKFP